MIDPQVEIVDLDPVGFVWLNGVALQRPIEEWLWVLHEGGDMPDLDRLRAERKVDRVVLLDRSQTAELSRQITEAARPDLTQQEWFQAAERLFWASPAVRTSPAPPTRPPSLLEELLGDRGDGSTEIHFRRGAETLLVLSIERQSGRIARMSSASRGEPDQVLEADEVERYLAGGGSIL